jgi:O-antigen ligase
LLLAPGRALSRGRLHDPAVVLLSCAAAFAVGWAVVEMPTAALLPAAAVASLPLLLSAHARIIFVVFGMLLIFGTSEELTLPKLAYLAGLGVAAGGAIFNVQTVARTPAFHTLKPLVLSSFALVALVLVSFPVAEFQGTFLRDWLRDSAPYVMAAMAPLFALDAYASLSKRALERLLLGAGLLGALSFAVTWMERRGIGTLGLDVLGLPTILLGAALFAYAMSALIQGDKRRGLWLGAGVLTFALLISSGTRTSFILLAAPFAIAFGSTRQLGRRSLRLAIALPLVMVLVAVAAQSVLKAADADEAIVRERISLLFESGSQQDGSYIERVNATRTAWESFRSSPLVGIGPGAEFTYAAADGQVVITRNIDTPILLLARFGLVGLVWVVIFAVAYIAVIRRLARADPQPTVSRLALIGFGSILLANALLLVPFEDKGFSAAILLLFALALRESFGEPRPAARR